MQDSQGDAARADVAALFESLLSGGARRPVWRSPLKFCAFGRSWTPMDGAPS
jgi:hypothetical protein